MLRKILEKISITNEFTQCKTSRTLKIDVFEIPYNKNIGKLLSKYELLLLDQANSSSDPTQILILWFPIPRASLPPSPSLSSLTLVNWNPSSTQSSSCSSSVSIFCPTPFNHTPPQVLDPPNHMATKPIKFIIKLFTDHNTSWVKRATHQKVESLKAAFLSRLDNTVNNNSIFNTKYAECIKWYGMEGAPSFSQPCLCIQPPLPSPTKILSPTFLYFLSSPLTFLFHPYFLTKSSLQPTLIRSSSIPQHFFHLSIFAYNHPSNLHQKHFPYLSYLVDSGCTKEQRSNKVL